MDETSHTKMSPRDILRLVMRRRRLFLLGASLFCVLILVTVHWWPVKYKGTAKFTRRVDPAAEQLLGGKSESFETRKLTLLNDLSGDRAIERSLNDLGLFRGLPRAEGGQLTGPGEMRKQEMIQQIRKNTLVEWEVRADQVDLVAVTYTDPDPVLAEKIPNTLVNNYMGWASDQIVSRLSDSEKFLKEQRERCRRQVATSNEERVKFEIGHAGAMPQSPGALEEEVRKLTADLEARRRQLDIVEKKKQLLLQAAELPTTMSSQPFLKKMGPNPDYERLKVQVREAEDLLDVMITIRHMTKNHPDVAAQEKKISQFKESLANTPEKKALEETYGPAVRATDPTLELAMVRADIDGLNSEIARLERQAGEAKKLQENFAPYRKEYVGIMETLKDREDEQKKWETRYLEVQMALEAESAKKRTLHESVLVAQPQYRPSSPSLYMVLGLALAGGLGFGAGLVFLAKVMDRSVVTADDASRHFDMPILGVTGEIVTDAQQRRKRLMTWTVTPVVTTLVLVTIGILVLDIVLWLEHPETFKQWRQSPMQVVTSLVKGTGT